MDATLFPHKSPFPKTMPSFNHFEQNTHTCPLIYYPSDRILNRTREPSLWKGGEPRDKNTLSPPPSSHLAQRSRPLLPSLCCPTPESSYRSLCLATWETAGNQNGGVSAEATLAAHAPPPPALTAPYPLKCPIWCHLHANATIPRAFQGY